MIICYTISCNLPAERIVLMQKGTPFFGKQQTADLQQKTISILSSLSDETKTAETLLLTSVNSKNK